MRRAWLGLALALAAGGCGHPSSPSGDGLLPIDEVVVQVAESYPVQVTARVVGYLPDGCTSLSEISQNRVGNTVSIVITTRRSGSGGCVMVIEPVEKWIALRGLFPPGDYLLQVNDHLRRFRVD
ncbi:MAG TPA: hypothetical protein VJU18_17125 [Vicinamibacteria bacterium]|nr:hypothetical protein [Vicinamibacteria bacterium]